MPDWLNLDDEDLPPKQQPKLSNRQRRKQDRAQTRADAARRRDEQLHQARRQVTPGGALLAILVLVVVLVASAFLLPRLFGRDDQPASQPAAPATAPSGTGQPTPDQPAPTAEAETPRSSPTDPTTSASSMTEPGKDLSKAFLTAFLTRSNRADDAWVTAVEPYATADLIESLEADGPDAIGLTKLTSWEPTKYDKTTVPDQPVDTPSRVVSSWIVTITDGDHTMRKPFVLHQYLIDDGSWRVAILQMPYTSEG